MRHVIRIRKREFPVKIMTVLLLVVLFKYFFLPADFSSILVKYNTDGTFLFLDLCVMVCLVVVVNFRRWDKGYFGNLCIALLCFFVVELLYSMIRYRGLNITRSIAAYSYFLLIPLYFFLKISFERYNGYTLFIRGLTVCSIILCVLMILSAASINMGANPIQHFYELENGTYYARNGMVRIYSGAGLVMTSFVVSTIYAFSGKDKLLHILNMVLCVWQTVYVTQTRMTMVVMLVVGIVTLMNRKTRNRKLKRMILIAFALLAVVLLIQELGFSTTEISFLTRLYSYDYFLKYGLTHPLGFGFLTDSDSAYWSILHSPSMIAYVSDVGIVGTFGNFGIIPVIWYVVFVLKIFRTKLDHIARPVFTVYFLASMATLIPLSYSSMPIIPISMAIVEYLYKEQKKTYEKEITCLE